MPSLEHLDSKNTLNALLNAMLGLSTALPAREQGLRMNLTRLSDKAILEYEAARESFDRYLKPAGGGQRPFSELFKVWMRLPRLARCADCQLSDIGV